MPQASVGHFAACLFFQIAAHADDPAGHNPDDVFDLPQRGRVNLQLHHPISDCHVDEPQSQKGELPLFRAAQGRVHLYRHAADDQSQRQHPQLRQRHRLPPTFLQVDQGRGAQPETG